MDVNQEQFNFIMNFAVLESIIDIIGKCPVCESDVSLTLNTTKKKGFVHCLDFDCISCDWSMERYTSEKVKTKEDNSDSHSVQRLFNSPPLTKINPPFYVNPPFLKNVIPPIEKSIYPIPIVVTILTKGALSVIYKASIWYGQMDMRIIISSHYFDIILKSFFKSLNNINNTSNLVLTETFKKYSY